MRKNTIYFIVNLQARNGYSLKTWEKVVQEMKNKNISYQAYFTEFPGHASDLAKEIGEKTLGHKICLVSVGGDGTLHEVVNGAVAYPHLVVSNIPTGSGNDFARGFHIPREGLAALQLIIDESYSEERRVDIGAATVGGKNIFFANSMGAGLDAAITTMANESKIKKVLNRFSLGMLVYVSILLKQLFVYRRTSIEVTIDEKKRTFSSVWFVTISNQPFYGGGMKIAPQANAFDGEFDVTIVHDISRLKILLLFISVFWGGHTGIKGVECFSGRTIHLASKEALPVHADGEYAGTTPLEIRVVPDAITILRLKESFEMKKFTKEFKEFTHN